MRRRTSLSLIVALLVVGSTTVALANHGAWANGCHDGATCWWDGAYLWSANVHSDHRDIDTFPNTYSSGNSLGWSTDYIQNDMNLTHADIYKWSNYNTPIGCLNPNQSQPLDVRGSATGSWLGEPGNC